jgi:hypothetical protein
LNWTATEAARETIRCRGKNDEPTARDERQDDLFGPPLGKIINLRDPLVRLAGEIDWGFLA